MPFISYFFRIYVFDMRKTKTERIALVGCCYIFLVARITSGK